MKRILQESDFERANDSSENELCKSFLFFTRSYFATKSWEVIETKIRLKIYVFRIIHINIHHLFKSSKINVAIKMSWIFDKQIFRSKDIAYFLLDLFNVNMSLLYDKDKHKAFQRLQYEILRLRRNESIFVWSWFVKKIEILFISISFSSILAHDYVIAFAFDLFAFNSKYFLKSNDIVLIHSNHFERVNLHAFQVLFDELIWILKRNFIKNNDRKKRQIFASNEISYVASFVCSKELNMHVSIKFQMMMSSNDLFRRKFSINLEFFNKSEIKKLQKLKVEEYRFIQKQSRAHKSNFSNVFRREFTLQLFKRCSISMFQL